MIIGRFFRCEEGRRALQPCVPHEGFENNAILARYLAVVAFVILSLERLHKPDVVEDALPPVRRYSLKLSCGALVNVDDPGNVGVGRA